MLLYSCVGSGYFAETHSPENLAKVKYTDMSRRVVVSPLLDGDVQVEIQDLCLSSESRAVSNVHIAGAHSVHLVVRDKVCDTYGFGQLRPERAICLIALHIQCTWIIHPYQSCSVHLLMRDLGFWQRLSKH